RSATPHPAPNILFILDASGSWPSSAVPATGSSYSNLDDEIWDKAYVHNSLYYTPANTYQGWKKADGSRVTGGDSYSAAYASENLVGGSTTNLGNKTQTFYVPKPNATDLDDPDHYDKYEIKYVDGSLRVVKSGAEVDEDWDNADIDEREWRYDSINVPAGTTSLIVS